MNLFGRDKIYFLELAGLLLSGMLFFIWPIGGTISIRDVLSITLLIIFAYITGVAGPRTLKAKGPAAPFVILAILTAWIVFGALFISRETAWSLKEIPGQWLLSVVAFVTAGLAGLRGASTNKRGNLFRPGRVITLFFLILLAHILYIDIYALYKFARTSVLPAWVSGLTPGKDKSSYLSHFLLMILCVEIYFRALHKRQFIPINNRLLFLSMLLTLFSIYLEGVRNGTVEAVLLLLVFTLLYFLKSGGGIKRVALASSVITLMLLFGYVSSISSHSEQRHRWQTFLETLPLALDTQHNKGWLNPNKYPYPRLKSGETVHGSNYERIAWFKEGIILVWENPLGVGFGRTAFGHALHDKYGEESVRNTHSHIGIVDFSIGTGIPGFLLWMAFLTAMMCYSLKKYLGEQNYAGLLLFFIIIDFSMRMVVDSVMRDHMLQMFMFLAGFLYVSMPGFDMERGKPSGDPDAQTDR